MKKILIDWALLVVGIVLFALPQPTFLFVEGLPFLSYISFIPIFLLVRRVSWKTVWLYGLLYGVGGYYFFVNWLAGFHPLGIHIITVLYGTQLLLVFVALKAAWVLCGKHGWIVQWIVWCAHEYLKTQGFAGFNYGVTAYSHWQLITLIQSANVIGIWGLSAIITFPSAWISKVLQPLFEVQGNTSVKNTKIQKPLCAVKNAVYTHRVSGIVWLVIFVGVIVYGLVSVVDYSDYDTKTVALMQPNSDPWVGGTAAYTRDFKTLSRLTDEALAESDDIDFIVWPETAFIPSIRYHYKYREDRIRLDLVNDLLDYIDTKDVPFVLGNGDRSKGYTRLGTYGTLSYNSVFLFRPNENTIPPEPEVYNKMHLVPFTEHFPFEKMFPTVYEALLNNDTHMWTPGTEPTVFTIDGLSFGTPICFEDTFGYIGRRFVQNGAQAIVNLSNDSWSESLACQYQHLSMAVFRSVENRIPSVRSTASGQTCIIDPNGRVTAMIEPFSEGYLVGDFPIMEKGQKTLYTLWGDYVGIVFTALATLLLGGGLVTTILRKRKGK